MANFYDFSVTSAKSEEIKMADFKGKVVLIYTAICADRANV